MVGSLTCLWMDLLNQDVAVKPEDVILLLQRVLVLLVSASCISQERRRVTWSQTNPATNTLPNIAEETEAKEIIPFGARFLERATKRLEEEKVLTSDQNKAGTTTSKVPLARPGPIWPLPFFGEWHPCKVQQQEPRVPAAILSEKNIQIPKKRQQEWVQVEDKQQLNCAQTINLQFINCVYSLFLECQVSQQQADYHTAPTIGRE